MNSAVREMARLREKLKRLADEAAKNDAILRRSQARELELLNAPSLAALLDCMVERMRESFDLTAVTVVLCDPQHEIRHLLVHGGELENVNSGVLFVDALTGLAPQYASLNKPWLGRYSRSDHALVFPGAEDLGSVALIPLSRQERLMGSMNFGSRDPERFTRAHATDFLAHLGVIASFALENSVNRARLLRSGLTDVLTGWHNRRYLQTRLAEELGRAHRDKSTLTCLMLDLDHFKAVNDTYGHLAGDVVLSEVAHRIDAEIRVSDVAARYGGEEFVILLPQTDEKAALAIAERIRAAVGRTPFRLPSGIDCDVTVSIGVSSIRPSEQSGDLKSAAEGLIARADVALYKSKSAGRDCVST